MGCTRRTAHCRATRRGNKIPHYEMQLKNHCQFFRQKRHYTTQRRSETMGCTRRNAHCRATRRGSKIPHYEMQLINHCQFFRQKRYYTTQRRSEAMGCTRRTAHCRATRRGSRMPLFTKKSCSVYSSASASDDSSARADCRFLVGSPRRRSRSPRRTILLLPVCSRL